jgi:hypothetical protein
MQPGSFAKQEDIPATIYFHEHTVSRIPVLLTAEVQSYIDGSTHEGRIFSQALAESFSCFSVQLLLQLDADAFVIHVESETGLIMTWKISADVLVSIDPYTRVPVFRAHETAQELSNLYRTALENFYD